MLVDRYATYTGSDPRRAPAALATVPYVEQTFGAYHVAGGIRRLADALHDAHAGARRRATGSRATSRRCSPTRRGVTGVRLADGEVLDGRRRGRQRRRDPPLPRPAARPARRRAAAGACVARRRRSRASCCCSPCAVARPGLRHHNVWFPDDYDAEFDAIFGRRAAARRRPDGLRLRARRRRDATRRRARVVVRPRQRARATRTTRRAGHGRLDGARAGASPTATGSSRSWPPRGVRRPRPPAVVARSARPPTSSTTPRAPGGSIYGTSSNGARAAFLRPANASPVPGLFLVGGSSHPGGGLPLVGHVGRDRRRTSSAAPERGRHPRDGPRRPPDPPPC